METYNYAVTMAAPLGQRRGVLRFESRGGSLTGTLTMFGNSQPIRGALLEDGQILFAGTMVSLLRSYPYQTSGRLSGKKIELELVSGNQRFPIAGERIKETEK